MTIKNILDYADRIKGLDIIGIVDCASPPVIKELERLLNHEFLINYPDKGIFYQDRLLLILGAEVEIFVDSGRAHFLTYFPSLENMKLFSSWAQTWTTNINLSTQLLRVDIQTLVKKVHALEGFILPAHAFTPYKGLLGSCTDSLYRLEKEKHISFKSVELGLSADNYLADAIPSVRELVYLSNSDAHSLPKIAREYSSFYVNTLSFYSIKNILHGKQKNSLNLFGLHPQMGKYYRSYCTTCLVTMEKIHPPVLQCYYCNSENIITGVLDRIAHIGDETPEYFNRHPQGKYQNYTHQVLLENIPGLGPKTHQLLLKSFGNEMDIIHHTDIAHIRNMASSKVADWIKKLRDGKLEFVPGGGGLYGKIKSINQS